MKITLKKLLCGVLSASMLVTSAVIPTFVSAQELSTDELLMDITFDETNTGSGSFNATVGGTVTENGSISYENVYQGNKALSITSNTADNYLKLPNGLLNGKESATFSFKIKPNSGWAFMTTPVASQTYLSEKYLGMLATSSALTAERYNNSGTRLSSVIANGDYTDWQHVAVVFTADGTKLYVNGELAKYDTAEVNISELFTADASTWIGHGNWGSGEGFSGMIDDFQIYGKALSESDIATLSSDISDYRQKALVYDNNCFVTETHFYEQHDENDKDEIFSLQNITPITLETEISINNYTTNDDSYTASLYLVTEDGSEEQLTLADNSKAVSGSIASGEEKDISLTLYTSTILGNFTFGDKIVARVTLDDMEESFDASLYGAVQSPQTAPADSDVTTNGAHDPSIVKFLNDDTYYVYSSHHLIFTSTDLINWTKHDFTNIDAKDISPKCYNFINSNYTSTTMNGTYWAPDVYYKEGDDHPYWMYISVSCGLGGRNSVIALMKSDSPLFWADENADIVDAGIVFATKETSGYITNAIDANIYTDTSDNNQLYFIWGSFWGGIQSAPLNDDGFVVGISYTSDATILSSCKNFGTSVFTQKNGVAGPEGAWMLEHEGYRYMFTSYGWLGSNYNTRVARAPLSSKFSENMGTQLVDANGVVMGTQQTLGSTSRSGITGYKLIGSYRLGDGTMTMTKDTSSSGYCYARTSDGAHVYYGPGHNSAIVTDGGDCFYISHTRKDAIEGAATLQARKMLWTEDGWPVVSPITYSGEIEQALPKEMLLGTYDLASVGYTKMEGSTINTGTNPNRNYDLPVVSSKITLNEDGTLANDLGTWEFDNDHTVTITFAKDGDATKDEFYKSGDVMTMYALLGYDKDEKASAIALTGIDQNHVTQFAKKLITNICESEQAKIITPITAEKSNGGNPILGFGDNNALMYAGDPAAMVEGDTVYIYAGHDTSTGDSYVMPEWVCYSSKDMENWTYHGKIMLATDVSWRNDNNSAWASQVIKHNGKYYLYFCTWDKTSSGKQSIGVAVADSPTGPFKDIGTPLVKGTVTTPETSSWNDIDPTVWVETVDGVEHRYLTWGNGKLYTCELNEDMISVKDQNGDNTITMDDITEQTISNASVAFTEAPFIYRRQDENGNYYGKYYLFYAAGWREQMAYATTDNLLSETWDFGGILMPPTATSNTNHPSVIDFKGKTYFIYHNGSLPWGSGFRRVVCVEEFEFNEDGSIDPIQETSTGLTGTASTITHGDNYLYYESFINPSSDDSYPISKSVYIGRNMTDMDTVKWEIVAGKADTSNENYVSIQAVNKPGLYLTASSDYTLYLTADAAKNDTAIQNAMTFRTIAGIDGNENTVTFESVSEPGYYITMQNGNAVLTKGKTPSNCSFTINPADNVQPPALAANVDKVWYEDNKTVHFRLNNALVYGSVNTIVAEYNSSGILIGVTNENKIDVTSVSQFIDIDYTRAEENSTLKLFVWNHMMPVTAVTEIKDTASPYAMPEGYTSYFTFDENLSDSISNASGTFVASKIEGDITAEDVLPSLLKDGYKGKAIAFTGANSYGVNLGNVITNSKYTIAFRMKANEFTACTSGIFINSGSKSSESWVSAPFGYQTGGNTMIWSKANSTYVDIASTASMTADTWHHVVIAADGTTASIYIDGSLVGSGTISDISTATTNTYLGVNYWDTPFNGLIDDMYIYNGTTLTSEQIENLYFATK